MRKLIGFFIKQPIWANAFIVVIVMFGFYNLSTIKKSFFPETDPRMIKINVMYPGASPNEIEDGITIKIEQALRGIEGVEQINSTSSENISSITVRGLENADMDEVFKDVENSINSINSFPQGAEKPIVKRIKTNSMSENVMTIGLTGAPDLFALKKEADRVENDLFSSGLISFIDIRGMPDLEIEVSVRENDLNKYGILIDEISLAIQRNNQDLTGGVLRGKKEQLIIRSRERTTNPREIEQIVLRTTPNGNKILIGDVANVSMKFSENSLESFKKGKPYITLDIKKTPDQDLIGITNFVKNYVNKYNKGNNNAEIIIQYEFAKSLNDRIDLLTSNGFVGLLLVLLMLGLFLSVRLSVWVAFGIPFSFLGMFILANMMGLTINMITLFGMILVVGILVDDGIVIAENIYAHFEKGKNPFRAALDGTLEVVPSVFTSVLTTIAAFSMLLFVEKMEIMQEMAKVVMFALAFSLIEAFIILPVHLASTKVLSQPKEGTFRKKFRDFFNNGITYFNDCIYGDTLKFVLKRYKSYVILPLIFVFFIVFFSSKYKVINYTFFPEIKPDRVYVEASFLPGTSKNITKQWLESVETIILESNKELAIETGDTLLKDYSILLGMAMTLGEVGDHAGSISLTIDGEGKATPVDSLNARIQKKLNSLELTKLTTNTFVGGRLHMFGKPIEFSLTSNNNKKVREATEYFKELLSKNPMIYNLKDNEPLGQKEINLKAKPEADFYGLGIFEISKQVRQGVFGQEVQRVIVGTDEVKIWVRYAIEDRQSMFDLENIKIKTIDGKQIPLTEIATYEIERGLISLKRRDGMREIVVDADVTDPKKIGDVNSEIVSEIIPKVKALYPGVEFIQRGQGERSTKAMNSMQINVLILMVVILLIMTLNFKSFFQALLILLVIPAGVAGGILGHAIVGIPVSILSAFGMIALIGILINDAIVFLDTYNRNLKEGYNVYEASVNSAKSRFRPIILTSITTVAGLLPLIMETSFQAQFLIPMAVSIASGILFGTFFILLFFPTIILVANGYLRVWNYVLNSDPSPVIGVLKLVITHFVFILFIVLFPVSILLPKTVVDKIVKLLWGNIQIDGRSIEPAIKNLNTEHEREI
ncbi:MAG TPA: efflux RND transporter permease subunit [Crocinitomix sp.]|nr:efflux RND transporter permease subunit [Crocinitomix sp.]